MNRRTRLLNDLSTNEQWTNGIEAQLDQSMQTAGEQNSFREIIAHRQAESHRLNRLIHQIESRDTQWQDQMTTMEDAKNDAELHDRFEAWRSRLLVLLDRAHEALNENITRINGLQKCQSALDSLRVQVNEIEQQRSKVTISSPDNSPDDGKDGVQGMKEHLSASKDKLKVWRPKSIFSFQFPFYCFVSFYHSCFYFCSA